MLLLLLLFKKIMATQETSLFSRDQVDSSSQSKARRMAKLSQSACHGARHNIRLSLLSNQTVPCVMKGLKDRK